MFTMLRDTPSTDPHIQKNFSKELSTTAKRGEEVKRTRDCVLTKQRHLTAKPCLTYLLTSLYLSNVISDLQQTMVSLNTNFIQFPPVCHPPPPTHTDVSRPRHKRATPTGVSPPRSKTPPPLKAHPVVLFFLYGSLPGRSMTKKSRSEFKAQVKGHE